MIYVLFNKGQPVHVTSTSPYRGLCTPEGKPLMRDFFGLEYDSAKCSPDFKSFEEVEAIAKHFTENGVYGRSDKPVFIAYDDGEWTSHRFGIMEPPKVGDKVSYAFNGDYYPCGEIVKITKGWRITTSEGKVFNRRKKITSRWVMVGGTWSLVQGHISKLNPEF